MRKCMKCGTTYEDDCTFCALDGERLVLVTAESPAPAPAPVQNQQLQQPAPVPAPVQDQQLQQPVAPAPTQDQQLQQPVAPAPVPTPAQNQQPPKQGSASGPYNYGMTVIEKAVVGVLIGIIALAIVLGILFITGVLGGK